MGKSKKKIDTANSVKNSPPDKSTPEQTEKAPESAMNQPLGDSGFNLEDHSHQARILDHEDFVRMSRRHA